MNLENLIVLVMIATMCAFVAERMTRRLPFGLVGTIFAGLLGAWMLVEMFHWRIPGDMTAGGVPVLTAFLGAVAVIFLTTTMVRDPLNRRRS